METQNPTTNHVAEAERASTSTSAPERSLTELTRCLSDAYTARARLRLDRGERDLAVADLNEAIRLAPDNDEARRLLEHLRDQLIQAMPGSGTGESGDRPGKIGGNPLQAHFRAGYQVSARYHAENNHTDTLLTDFPLTDEGRQQAIEYARHMCREESRTQRRELYDAYWSHGEDFDAVVTEVRSIVRQVHLEKALDDDGRPLID